MAPLRPGSVSGYQSAGRDVRADAGKPAARSIGGTPAIGGQHPSLSAQPLKSPGTPVRLRSEVVTFSRNIQRAQFVLKHMQSSPSSGSGTAWTASTVPPSGPGGSGGGNALPSGPGMPYNQGAHYSATQVHPAYGGAAYNNGGGNLANSVSGTANPAAVRGGPYQALPVPSSPGERVTSRPPTSIRQSMAGRDRRAANFKQSHNGPKIIQGQVEPPDGA